MRRAPCRLRPSIRAEFADSALIKVFGQSGEGLFFIPSVVEREVCAQYDVEPLGRLDEVRDRFFAVTIERTIRHPAVAALCEAARKTFEGPGRAEGDPISR